MSAIPEEQPVSPELIDGEPAPVVSIFCGVHPHGFIADYVRTLDRAAEEAAKFPPPRRTKKK